MNKPKAVTMGQQTSVKRQRKNIDCKRKYKEYSNGLTNTACRKFKKEFLPCNSTVKNSWERLLSVISLRSVTLSYNYDQRQLICGWALEFLKLTWLRSVDDSPLKL